MYQRSIKRILDIIFSVIAIIIFLPAGLVLALVIKLDSKGPAIFAHPRFGQDKRPFTIYKFRSMSVHTPRDTPTNSLRNATSYITRVGKVMRKLSLDELPQLINVLKGEMSLVGPRPVVLNEIDLILERDKYGANTCKPGITGWAQVNGRDEVRMKKKAEMDGEYVSNLGPIMDIKCIFMTVYAVLSIKGHKEGSDEDPTPSNAWADRIPDLPYDNRENA